MVFLDDNYALCYFPYLQLCDLYENDSIFDRFECCPSCDGIRLATVIHYYVLNPLP